MKFVKGALVAFSLAAGLTYMERIVDPLDRQSHNYTLEPSDQYSELPVYSTNWHDPEGAKHDDRFGDALLVFTALAGTARVIIAIGEFERIQKDPVNLQGRSVT